MHENNSNGHQISQIFVRSNSNLVKIDLKDILWIEAQGNYLSIKTMNDRYLIHGTLKNLNEKLPDAEFIRIHRSFIISVNKIDSINGKSIMINEHSIPISNSNRQQLLKCLTIL
ncbi:MAG: LytTR family transcriptional regulator [Bacteroidetes bacterium]|nr:LytTR family transcriptional regulator [Bacteroidota bacterium]